MYACNFDCCLSPTTCGIYSKRLIIRVTSAFMQGSHSVDIYPDFIFAALHIFGHLISSLESIRL